MLAKFKAGDRVIVCDTHEDTYGRGWRSNGYHPDYINKVANTECTVDEPIEILGEVYYRLDQFSTGYVAEYALKPMNILGYRLIKQYPGCTKKVGDFEPYTTGEYSQYPEFWEPVCEGKKIKVGKHEMQIMGSGVKFGCQTFTKIQVQALEDLLSRNGVILELKINGQDITLDLVRTVLAKM